MLYNCFSQALNTLKNKKYIFLKTRFYYISREFTNISLIYASASHIVMFWNPRYIKDLKEKEKFILVGNKIWEYEIENLACQKKKKLYLRINAPLLIL